jgi:hypothetical protein
MRHTKAGSTSRAKHAKKLPAHRKLSADSSSSNEWHLSGRVTELKTTTAELILQNCKRQTNIIDSTETPHPPLNDHVVEPSPRTSVAAITGSFAERKENEEARPQQIPTCTRAQSVRQSAERFE